MLIYRYNPEAAYITDELRKNGIYVVSYEYLTGFDSIDNEKYIISKSDVHPNAKNWEMFVPIFYNYLLNIDKEPDKKQIVFENEKRKDYEDIYDKTTMEKTPITQVIKNSNWLSYSVFSLQNRDEQLIKEKKITRFQTKLAYTVWCLGDILKDTPLNFAGKQIKKVASKINKYNEMYQQ